MAISPEHPAPVLGIPPGWYADPQGQGQRWWDGSAWTAHWAPPPPPLGAGENPKSRARTGDWIGGVLLGLFMPVVGFIAGVVYMTKGGSKQTVGIMTTGISVMGFLFWLVVRANAGY